MKPGNFTSKIRDVVVQQNAAIYKDLFVSTPISSASDPYWKRALALYNSLTLGQREVFFEIIRQTMVDTTSNIFAILDSETEDFALVSKTDLRKINGNLQDIFLEKEEQGRETALD